MTDRASRLVGALAEVVLDPGVLLVVVLPTLAVAVVSGLVVALVTWSAWTFVVVVVVGSTLGVLVAIGVPVALGSAIDRALEWAGRLPLPEESGEGVASYWVLAAGPAVALVVALVVAFTW